MILKDFYTDIKNNFQRSGVETAALDARLLMCHALRISHENFVLHSDKELPADDIEKINALITQRLAGRPVAKIIGSKEFYGRDFKTTDDTLDPRPDSETLIEAVLSAVKFPLPLRERVPQAGEGAGRTDTVLDAPSTQPSPARGEGELKILDLGTGTGCLILTLLTELPNATGLAIDQSPAALAIAQENARQLQLDDRIDFLYSDWFSAVAGNFDIIISNPPYIPENDIADLATEVRNYDPLAALAGGADGLDPYRLIIPQLRRFLKPGGLAAFEVGQGQASAVAALLKECGFIAVTTHRDLAGIERVVTGIRPE